MNILPIHFEKYIDEAELPIATFDAARKGQFIELSRNGSSLELTSLDWQELGGLVPMFLKKEIIGLEEPGEWISMVGLTCASCCVEKEPV